MGAQDVERRLFDALIPLPDGTSYNSYIIRGSGKTALIDTVDPTKTQILLDNLKALGIQKLDYIIAHHGEQDHSGSIPAVLKVYPSAKVVTNQKCKDELIDLMMISDDKFMVINDRETLSLGDKTLEFIFAPWVHWPETMLTYLREDKILFTCDFLGAHLSTKELYFADINKLYQSAKRYYAEIMMPFRVSIKKHVETVRSLAPTLIAPSHGPLHNNPAFILDAYQDWVSDTVKNEVVIPYVSMHGSTQAMVDYFVKALEGKGIKALPFDLAEADIGELAMALVDASTVVIGSPTVLAGPHPKAVFAAVLANALRPKTKYVSIIGSFGWGGKMVEQLSALLPNLKVEVLAPVLAKGYPKETDFKGIDKLVEAIYNRKQ